MKYLLIFFLFFQYSLYANASKVLFISSYNSSFPTIPKQINGIKKVLPESKYQIDIEYMDTKRIDPRKVESIFLSSLLLKASLLKEYDAILVGDDNALRFVQKYQDKLFKNQPIIFLAINNELFAKNISNNKYITGVIEKQSVTQTLQLIKKLHPSIFKIVVLSDTTTTSDGILKSFSKTDLSNIEILSLKDHSYKELGKKLKNLPKTQPLLYVSVMADKNGERKDFYQSIDFIKQNGDLPLYHLYEHGIGEGMIGGKVVMFSKQGEIAADMVHQVLSGVDIENINYIPESKNHYLFDYSELKKYQIEESLLPRDSIVLNKPESFLKENFEFILQVFSTILLFMVIVIAILLIRSKQRSSDLEALTDKLNNASKIAKLGTWEWEPSSDTFTWIDITYSIHGVENGSRITLGLIESLIYGDDVEQYGYEINKALEKHAIFDLVYRIKKDHEIRTIHAIGNPIINNNTVIKMVGVVQDITEHKEKERALKKAHDNLNNLLNLQDNIVILSDGVELNFANQKFFEFLGFKDMEDFKQQHKSISELFIENDRFFHIGKVDEDKNWAEVIQTLPHTQRIVSILGNDFKPHAFSVAVNRFNDELFIFNFSDISQTMLKSIELELKTIHDKLTGAYNREYFEQTYSILINEYEILGFRLGVALIDIDHFKSVNDTHGHDVGDEVLKHFVDTIHKYSRSDDIFIRWGGEEFILLIKVKTKEDLQKALEHLRTTVEIQSFPTVGQKTCSIGGTIYQKDEDIETTIKRADEAVYDAKAAGRNRVIIK